MRKTPSINFCGWDFGSAATARSSRGIASAYFPDSNAFTPLRYGSAHRLFCADADVLITRSSAAASGACFMTGLQPAVSEPDCRREHELLPKHVRGVDLHARAEDDADAGRAAC